MEIKLNKLTINDKKFISKFLRFKRHELAVYTFENIFIWNGLFDIYWTQINESLCIFFKDSIGYFLYLEPLAKKNDSLVVKAVFDLMNSHNENKDYTRIENVEEANLSFYEQLGLKKVFKATDYVCKKKTLVDLKTSAFKKKRLSINQFLRNYKFEYSNYAAKHKDNCIDLYKEWMKSRSAKNQDTIYNYMLKDNLNAFKNLLEEYPSLDCKGRVLIIDDKIKAFTFGVESNEDTFCILYEIADLSIKGIAQFIFQKFCEELDYKYINIMDDSGLENLKKVKLSYQPEKLIESYIIAPY